MSKEEKHNIKIKQINTVKWANVIIRKIHLKTLTFTFYCC